MGILDTIMNLNPFKKKDEFSFEPLDNNLGQNEFSFNNDSNFNQNNFNQGLESTPQFNNNIPNSGFSPMSSQQQSQQQSFDNRMRMPLGENIRQEKMHSYDEPQIIQKENPLEKDLELISAKLDYLKASLESINQRLANLEHMARQESERNSYQYQKRF